MNGPTLLTALGALKLIPTVYELNGRKYPESAEGTPYASVALWHLLRPRPTRVLVLLTCKARDMHWQGFQAALRAAGGPDPEAVDIPEGHTEAEFWEIFLEVVSKLADTRELVLDVTGGLRSIPLIFVASTAFIHGVSDVKVKGIYYGAFEARKDGGPAPIFDLTRFWTLMEGYHAARAFTRAGDPTPAVSLMREWSNLLVSQARAGSDLSEAVRGFEELARPLLAGLPLETGNRIAMAVGRLERLVAQGQQLPPGLTQVLDLLKTALLPFSFPIPVRDKGRVVLDEAELRRQLNLIDWYRQRGHAASATLLLREWIVNRVLLACGQNDGWLQRQHRKAIEVRLGSLRKEGKRESVGSLWEDVCQSRNPYAHGGFRPKEVRDVTQDLEPLIQGIRDRLNDDSFWRIRPQPLVQRLLVCGLGRRPGALYTALCHLRPDRALVLTSEEAARALPEILHKADMPNLPVRTVTFSDPFAGFAEARDALDDLAAERAGAGEVVCSLTGGTTLMQYAVEQTGRLAERCGILVRRVAMVDRRSDREQAEQPYVLGEMVPLEETGEQDEESE